VKINEWSDRNQRDRRGIKLEAALWSVLPADALIGAAIWFRELVT
jgi:hypothetical protein